MMGQVRPTLAEFVRLLALGWLSVLAAACSDALVASDYEGDALYSQGQLRQQATNGFKGEDYESLRYAVFWSPDGFDSAPEEVVEQRSSSRPLPAASAAWSLFEAPPDAVLARTAAGGRYGLGRLRVYDDRDRDRSWDAEEPLVGDSWEALLYVPRDLPAEQAPLGRALPAGVHRIELPAFCAPATRGNEACGVVLGRECRNDDPCGQGVCMLAKGGRLWSHGMCGLPYDAQDPCLPADGTLFLNPAGDAAFFLAACVDASDCRADEICDHGIGACLSGTGHTVVLGAADPPTLCRAPQLPTPSDSDAGM